MEENKYLTLARQARAEDNSEDAKTYYNKVREEDPENAEAKFFYAYYALYEGKNNELSSRFTSLCKVLSPTLKFIKESTLDKDEKLKTLEEIVDAFTPTTWTLNRYMNNKNHETKIGDSYVKVFDLNTIKSVSVGGMNALKTLGDEIDKQFLDPACKKIAVTPWKEYVSIAQKWYAWAPKGDAEIYAEKIKKYEPSYQMPEKAGCISLANKK